MTFDFWQFPVETASRRSVRASVISAVFAVMLLGFIKAVNMSAGLSVLRVTTLLVHLVGNGFSRLKCIPRVECGGRWYRGMHKERDATVSWLVDQIPCNHASHVCISRYDVRTGV